MAWANDGVAQPLQKGRNITLRMTDPAGSVAIEQPDGAGGWFQLVQGGEDVVLDADNTVRSLYAPCKLLITPTGTDVELDAKD